MKITGFDYDEKDDWMYSIVHIAIYLHVCHNC